MHKVDARPPGEAPPIATLASNGLISALFLRRCCHLLMYMIRRVGSQLITRDLQDDLYPRPRWFPAYRRRCPRLSIPVAPQHPLGELTLRRASTAPHLRVKSIIEPVVRNPHETNFPRQNGNSCMRIHFAKQDIPAKHATVAIPYVP